MKILKPILYISALTVWIFIACQEHPHDEDPASTITPGNNLEVDSATAHANNSTDTSKTKGGNMDSAAYPNNKNMGANNVNTGTKGNDNVKPSGSNSKINTNNDKRNPK